MDFESNKAYFLIDEIYAKYTVHIHQSIHFQSSIEYPCSLSVSTFCFPHGLLFDIMDAGLIPFVFYLSVYLYINMYILHSKDIDLELSLFYCRIETMRKTEGWYREWKGYSMEDWKCIDWCILQVYGKHIFHL